MQDVELNLDPQVAEANPSGLSLLHQLNEPTRTPWLIGIDGRSGAGKSTLAHQLQQVLQGRRDVTVFHLEDLYPGWKGLSAGTERYVQEVLAPLRLSEDAYWSTWDWVTDSPGGPRLTRAADIVICEGVGACSAAARELLDVSIWVEYPAAGRKERALRRDGETFAPFWDIWAAQEEQYLEMDPVWDSATIIQPGPPDGTAP